MNPEKREKRQVLVTGVTGKSGRAFCDALAAGGAEGFDVTLVARDASRVPRCGARVVVADLADERTLARIFAERRYDLLVHIAGIHLSEAVVSAAAHHGVGQAILVHTTGIWSRHKREAAFYKTTEDAVKGVARGCGMKLVTLRPTMIYGDLDDRNVARFIAWADRWPIIPLIGGGGNMLQPVWCRDVGSACYAAMVKADSLGEKEYVISGAQPITFADMMLTISRKLGRRRVFVPVSLRLARLAARMLALATLGRIDWVERVERMGESRAFGHGAARRDLGYDPASFAEGVDAEIEAWRRRKEAR